MRFSIENGRVMINRELLKKNIEIEESKIVKISNDKGEGEKIDASGKIVLPGLIDMHVHLREPGFTTKEDIRSGTRAAAAGGVTTVFDMPNTNPATTTVNLLQEKRELMRKSIVNYGLYMGATSSNLEEIKKAENIAGVKVYMGSSTGDLLVTDEKVIRNLMSTNKKIVIHAEDEEMIKKNMEKYKGNADSYVHSKIRDSEVEVAAVKKALKISASNQKQLHFTHISSWKSLDVIKGSGSSCDVTPHHLFLTAEELKKQGNFAKMNPALKSKEDIDALWRGIRDSTVNCIATDHAGHTLDEKKASYWEAPSGVPGLETMLPLLLNAVNSNKLSLQKLVRLTSENPAKIFELKNKGKIEEGYDADIVIVDINEEKQVKNEELFTKCKWSPFNRWKLKGWPVTTIVNGEIVFEDGAVNNIRGKEVEFEHF